MKVTKRQLRRIIREEKAKSTKKYDDDSALKGGQSELPDPLQKGIIDKTVEEREEEEKKDETTRIRYSHLRKIIREAILSEVEFYDETPEGQLVGTEEEDTQFRNQLNAEKEMKAAGLTKDEIAQMWAFIKETADPFDFMETPMYEKLFDWFAFDGPTLMPYGTAKARDGDPDVWILDYLQDPSLLMGAQAPHDGRDEGWMAAK
jgi:hypothetical protein